MATARFFICEETISKKKKTGEEQAEAMLRTFILTMLRETIHSFSPLTFAMLRERIHEPSSLSSSNQPRTQTSPSLYIVYTIIFMLEIFTNNIVIRVTVQEDVRTDEGEANCMCIFLLGVPEVYFRFLISSVHTSTCCSRHKQ